MTDAKLFLSTVFASNVLKIAYEDSNVMRSASALFSKMSSYL